MRGTLLKGAFGHPTKPLLSGDHRGYTVSQLVDLDTYEFLCWQLPDIEINGIKRYNDGKYNNNIDKFGRDN